MTEREWIEQARRIAKRQSQTRTSSYSTFRRALAETCLLMSRAPTAISDSYSLTPESDLVAGSGEASDTLFDGRWQWTIDARNARSLAAGVGVRARALDLALNHEGVSDGPAHDPDAEYFCKASDAYVIPRSAKPFREGHGSRRHFRQRGTPHHRVIPKMFGSFVMDLHRLDRLEVDPSSERPLGAAMFENFTLLYDGDGENLVIRDVDCASAEATIRRQVAAACAANCWTVVWPEYTMPPRNLALLQEQLLDVACSAEPAAGPDWVLAGSWRSGEPAENVAWILDGYGYPALSLAKAIPYRENQLGVEAIQPRYRVPILVTDRALVAFGICRDFCEMGQETAWEALNVDLVVVASMGSDENTMLSHRSVAHHSVARGQRAFVVQQREKTGTGTTGWVLPPTGRAGALELNDLEVSDWSEHECDLWISAGRGGEAL